MHCQLDFAAATPQFNSTVNPMSAAAAAAPSPPPPAPPPARAPTVVVRPQRLSVIRQQLAHCQSELTGIPQARLPTSNDYEGEDDTFTNTEDSEI